jgi:hypothetical protein
MNYSTIEDAWKNSDYITEQYRLYDKPFESKIKELENFENDLNINYNMQSNNINNSNNKNNFNNFNNNSNNNFNNKSNNNSNNVNKHIVSQNRCSFTCDDFWEHLQNCKECRNKIRKMFCSKVTEDVKNIILDNKDTILLMLIGLFILIFFNLLIKLCKN